MRGLFGFIGFCSCVCLTFMDFGTSYMGIKAILPSESQSLLLFAMPVVVACLALSFNATSSYMLVMFQNQGYTQFSRTYLLCAWAGFVSFDFISSWVGMISEMYGRPLGSISGLNDALYSLEPVQTILATIVSVLATFGPFMATVFWDMTMGGQRFVKPLQMKGRAT